MPPVAVIAVDCPLQIEDVTALADIVGIGFTVRVTFAESAHIPLEPTITYVVVTGGDAIGLGQVEQLNPVAGLHVYVVAPLALNDTLSPTHTLGEEGVTVMFNGATIVTVTACVSLHRPVIPTTV